MSETEPSVRNELLASLHPEQLARLLPLMTRVPFPVRQTLYPAGGEITAVFFPESGMVSMVTTLLDGMQAEVGLIGREGVVGASVGFGVDTSFVEAMVQMPGEALSLPVAAFRAEFAGSEAFRGAVLRFNETLQAQVMQTAACNGRHELQQRMARWLLMCHDRVDAPTLPLTHEFIAMMLGVYRPSVTVVAGAMHRAGLISYGAGRISVGDRTRLEAAACGCYAATVRRSRAITGQGGEGGLRAEAVDGPVSPEGGR